MKTMYGATISRLAPAISSREKPEKWMKWGMKKKKWGMEKKKWGMEKN